MAMTGLVDRIRDAAWTCVSESNRTNAEDTQSGEKLCKFSRTRAARACECGSPAFYEKGHEPCVTATVTGGHRGQRIGCNTFVRRVSAFVEASPLSLFSERSHDSGFSREGP